MIIGEPRLCRSASTTKTGRGASKPTRTLVFQNQRDDSATSRPNPALMIANQAEGAGGCKTTGYVVRVYVVARASPKPSKGSTRILGPTDKAYVASAKLVVK